MCADFEKDCCRQLNSPCLCLTAAFDSIPYVDRVVDAYNSHRLMKAVGQQYIHSDLPSNTGMIWAECLTSQ
jgi:hypothetical protein